jgi:hypothetical protein
MAPGVLRAKSFMKSPSLLTIVSLTVAVFSFDSSAQIIFSDDFESYSSDSELTATWSRVSGTGTSILLAADPTNPSNQTIQQTTVAGRLRHVISGVNPTDAAPLLLSFDFYDSNGGTTSGRQYVEIRNSGVTGGLFDVGLINSVNTGTYAQGAYQARDIDNGNWVQLGVARSVGWHHFELLIEGFSATLSIDGIVDPSFSDRAWNGGASYDWLHIGSALTSNTDAYYDNISLAVVPEPSVYVAVFGALALGAAVIRRRVKS